MRRLLLLPFLLIGCETPESTEPDATVEMDAGVVDTGVIDSGTIDSGTMPDTGVIEVPAGWTELSGMPEQVGRWGARMVLIPSEERFLMFGGNTYPAGGSVDGLWSYSLVDDAWTEIETTGDVPAPRYCHCATYLPEQHQMLLVGGRDDFGPRDPEAFLFDIETSVWTQIQGPVPRGVIGCTAAWFPALGEAVVFGGGGRQGFDTVTWTFDPTVGSFDFVQTSSTPPGRSDPGEAFDEETGRLYIFGGGVRVFPPFEHLADTWVFDGTNWREITGPGPSMRRFPASAVDPERGWFLFGGTREEEDYADLWHFDFTTETWTEMQIDGAPVARGFPASAWDPRSRSLHMFGGLTQTMVSALSDGWRFRPE